MLICSLSLCVQFNTQNTLASRNIDVRTCLLRHCPYNIAETWVIGYLQGTAFLVRQLFSFNKGTFGSFVWFLYQNIFEAVQPQQLSSPNIRELTLFEVCDMHHHWSCSDISYKRIGSVASAVSQIHRFEILNNENMFDKR